MSNQVSIQEIKAANRFKTPLLKNTADALIEDIARKPVREVLDFSGNFVIWAPFWSSPNTEIALYYDAGTGSFVVRKSARRYLIKNEAQVLNHLNPTDAGDHIAKILMVTSAVIYIEAIDGISLDKYAFESNVLMRARFMLKLAEAVAAIHRTGVVHRDLKLENFLVTPEEELRVIDFAFGKIGKQDNFSHGAYGSVHYMSPEQCVDAYFATERSDIYALGVVFYKLIFGQLPFNHLEDYDMIIRAHKYEKPPTRFLIDLCLKPFSSLVMKCLEKESDKRFSSEDLLEAIREIMRQNSSRLMVR